MARNMGPDGLQTLNDCEPRGGYPFYPYGNEWRGIIQPSSSFADVTVYTCGQQRPLRIKQRDDRFNSPRVNRSPNNPTSRQDSLRAAWGVNTYI